MNMGTKKFGINTCAWYLTQINMKLILASLGVNGIYTDFIEDGVVDKDN